MFRLFLLSRILFMLYLLLFLIFFLLHLNRGFMSIVDRSVFWIFLHFFNIFLLLLDYLLSIFYRLYLSAYLIFSFPFNVLMFMALIFLLNNLNLLLFWFYWFFLIWLVFFYFFLGILDNELRLMGLYWNS